MFVSAIFMAVFGIANLVMEWVAYCRGYQEGLEESEPYAPVRISVTKIIPIMQSAFLLALACWIICVIEGTP